MKTYIPIDRYTLHNLARTRLKEIALLLELSGLSQEASLTAKLHMAAVLEDALAQPIMNSDSNCTKSIHSPETR